MKTIESTLRKLSMLYDFNRKLRAFAVAPKGKRASETMAPTPSQAEERSHREVADFKSP